jgi:hypothetical protein
MKENLYLSVIGLSLSVINELKSSINQLLNEQYVLNWTHLADSKLQVLLINEDFCDSQLLNKINKQIHILKLKKNIDHSSHIQDNTLFLPLTNLKALADWFKKVLNFSLKKNDSLLPTKLIDSANIQWSVIDALCNEINRIKTGKYVIKQNDTILALLDFDEFRFYKNSDAPLTDQVELELASLSTVVDYRRHQKFQDLKHGLWLFLFQQQFTAPPHLMQYYQIDFWPQIVKHTQRRDLYRIAALFMKGSTIAQATQQLNVPKQLVIDFILACVLCHCIETKNTDETDLINLQPQTLNENIKSIFSKLRRKLGL